MRANEFVLLENAADTITIGRSLVGSSGTKFQIGDSFIDVQHTGLTHSPRNQSIINFVVDENQRGQGIGKKLLAHAMKHFHDLGGQTSSTAAIHVLYGAGFRSPDEPTATVNELDAIRRENSSVYLAQNDREGNPLSGSGSNA